MNQSSSIQSNFQCIRTDLGQSLYSIIGIKAPRCSHTTTGLFWKHSAHGSFVGLRLLTRWITKPGLSFLRIWKIYVVHRTKSVRRTRWWKKVTMGMQARFWQCQLSCERSCMVSRTDSESERSQPDRLDAAATSLIVRDMLGALWAAL